MWMESLEAPEGWAGEGLFHYNFFWISPFFYFVFDCIFYLYYCNNEEVKIGNSSKLSKEVEEDEVEQGVFWTFYLVVAEGNLRNVKICVKVTKGMKLENNNFLVKPVCLRLTDLGKEAVCLQLVQSFVGTIELTSARRVEPFEFKKIKTCGN